MLIILIVNLKVYLFRTDVNFPLPHSRRFKTRVNRFPNADKGIMCQTIVRQSLLSIDLIINLKIHWFSGDNIYQPAVDKYLYNESIKYRVFNCRFVKSCNAVNVGHDNMLDPTSNRKRSQNRAVFCMRP